MILDALVRAEASGGRQGLLKTQPRQLLNSEESLGQQFWGFAAQGRSISLANAFR